jgi:hypothetical protein
MEIADCTENELKKISLLDDMEKKIRFDGYYYNPNTKRMTYFPSLEYISKIEKITDINSFIEKLNKLERIKNNTFFYRGHSNINYVTQPSVFRENYYQHESEMYQELLVKCPNDFKKCKSKFEHLKLMQHYGLPTRLLDVTLNPLIALYFACLGSYNNNGEVIIYDVPKSDIQTEENTTLEILSSLSTFEYEVQKKMCLRYLLIKCIEKFKRCGTSYDNLNHFNYHKDRKNFFHSYLNKQKKLLQMIKSMLEITSNLETEWIINILINQIERIYQTISNNDLICNEKERKNPFEPINYNIERIMTLLESYNIVEQDSIIDNLEENEILGAKFVMAKRDNSRIYNQSGAFAIFGLQVYKLIDDVTYYENPIDKYRYKEKGKRVIFIIEHSNKKNILHQLKSIGIDKSFIFPEIDDVAEYIKESYK